MSARVETITRRAVTRPNRIPGGKTTPPVPTISVVPSDREILIVMSGSILSDTNRNGYDISYTDTATGIGYMLNYSKDIETLTIPGLVNGRLYRIQARANGFGDAIGPFSGVVEERPAAFNAPMQNGNPISTTGQVVLNWLAPANIPATFSVGSYVLSCSVANANGVVSPVVPSSITISDNANTYLSYTYTGLTNNVQYRFTITAVYIRSGIIGPSKALTIDWSPLEVADIDAVNRFTFQSFNSTGYNICRYTVNIKAGHTQYGVRFVPSVGNTYSTTYTNVPVPGQITYLTDIGLASVGGLDNNKAYTCTITASNRFNVSASISYSFTTGREPIADFVLKSYPADGRYIYVASPTRHTAVEVISVYTTGSGYSLNGRYTLSYTNTAIRNVFGRSPTYSLARFTLGTKQYNLLPIIEEGSYIGIQSNMLSVPVILSYTAGGVRYMISKLLGQYITRSAEYFTISNPSPYGVATLTNSF